MVNYNGQIVDENALYLNGNNRGLLYGDALFETIRVVNGRLIFWEDHYLSLMSSMRILRMEIPMSFTMEFLEEQILMVLAGRAKKQFSQNQDYSLQEIMGAFIDRKVMKYLILFRRRSFSESILYFK